MSYSGEHLKTLSDLSTTLGIGVRELTWCSSNMAELVTPKPLKKADGTTRHIVSPQKQLREIQTAIKDKILKQYRYPAFVFALGGSTLREHAAVHIGNNELIKFDIKDFFPSMTHVKVLETWTTKFGFSNDVARILTKLTTFKGGVQQGFITSSHLAAIVAEDFANDFNDFCITHGYAFSQYVDDYNVSSEGIDRRLFFRNLELLSKRHGIPLNRKKTTVFGSGSAKQVTGVSVHNQSLRARRAVRDKAFKAMLNHLNNPEDDAAANSFNGYLRYIGGIRKKDASKLVAHKNRLKNERKYPDSH